MRILFVSDFLADRDSGAAGSLMAIGDALRRRGHEVDDLWRSTGGPRLAHPSLDRLLALPRRQLRQVSTRLAQGPVDVVVVSQPYAYRVFETLPRLHPRTLFLNRTHGWEERLLETELRYGLVPPASPAYALARRAGWVALRRSCRRTARAAHGIIAPSSRCARFVRDRYGGPAERVAVVPYGLDAAFRGLAAAAGAPSGTRFLFAGQYLPRKGTALLERRLPPLAGRHPGVSLTLVVPAHDAEKVDRRFRPGFGDRLSVVPWVPRSRLVEIYREHDVFLFPSYFEGFGKTFLEAMACGLCVVGFDEGGLSDMASNGHEALYCEAGDEAAFARLLERCAAVPEEVRAIGRRAREAVSSLTWDRTAAETERFVEQLLAQRGLPLPRPPEGP